MHIWSDTIVRHDNANIDNLWLYDVCQTRSLSNISASSALWYLHSRECTIEQGKIFALANLFPDLMEDLDPNQSILLLMNQFYNSLVKKDLSILCFGYLPVETRSMLVLPEYMFAPSWTGVRGSNLMRAMPTTSFNNYTVSENGYLHIHSTSLPVCVETIDRCPMDTYSFDVDLPQQDYTSAKIVSMDSMSYRVIGDYGVLPTHWLTRRVPQRGSLYPPKENSSVTVWFSLTENCNQCIVLTDVSFDIGMQGFMVYPVVTQAGTYYTAVGICLARNSNILYHGDRAVEEFVIR